MRSLSDIYNEAVSYRDQYLELKEMRNGSKMSIINAVTWTVSAAIYSFESLMNVFMLDIAGALNNRINGTPAYYANALLKFQYGDELTVNDDGTEFSYPTTDTSKQIITHVAYEEVYKDEYKDNYLMLKCAKGGSDNLEQLSSDELKAANAYLNEIKFAGVKAGVISRKGDIVCPVGTVYYDGSVSASDMYDLIDTALLSYFSNMGFDSTLYYQKVVDAIQSAAHVKDVILSTVYLYSYDDDGNLVSSKGSLVQRVSSLSSGYARQSTKTGVEANIPQFRDTLALQIEGSSISSGGSGSGTIAA